MHFPLILFYHLINFFTSVSQFFLLRTFSIGTMAQTPKHFQFRHCNHCQKSLFMMKITLKITVKITFGDEIIFFFFVASAVSCFLFDSLQVASRTYRPLPSPVVERKLRIQNSWPGVSGMRAWGVVVLRHHLFTPNKKRELKIVMWNHLETCATLSYGWLCRIHFSSLWFNGVNCEEGKNA